MAITFPLQPHDNPATPEQIEGIHAAPGFGEHFTDHMAVATWTADGGWHDAGVQPYAPLELDPASAVLHYAQEVFEGLKAYRHADKSVWLFRPEMNARRLVQSARRLCLPELPEDAFLAACEALVKADLQWVPDASDGESSLYLRPFEIAYENFLGVRAAQKALFCVIASPVGTYFAHGVQPIDIWVTDQYSRAGIGGTGFAKCGGNYASSLIAQYEGYEHGCSQVLFVQQGLDRVDELGGMNVFLVADDGTLVTPKLEGTILPGVTRDSILTLADSWDLPHEERALGFGELKEGIESGRFVEAFCCGTAAVISPISTFKSRDGEFALVQPQGSITMKLRQAITDIQFGRAEDTFGWLHRVA